MIPTNEKQLAFALVDIATAILDQNRILGEIQCNTCGHEDIKVALLQEDDYMCDCIDCGKSWIMEREQIKVVFKGRAIHWQVEAME